MPKCIVPEQGKRYVTADGFVTPPMQWDDDEKRWKAGSQWWSAKYFDADRDAFATDPVAEYQEHVLEWKRGIPDKHELEECWIVPGGVDNVPQSTSSVFEPGELLGWVGEGNEWHSLTWYLPVRVKPVERAKRTVRLWKWIETNGSGEYKMLRDDIPGDEAGGWTKTEIFEDTEVEDVRMVWQDRYYVSSNGRFMDASVYLVRNSPTSFYAMREDQTKGGSRIWESYHDRFVRDSSWKEITCAEANELMRQVVERQGAEKGRV